MPSSYIGEGLPFDSLVNVISIIRPSFFISIRLNNLQALGERSLILWLYFALFRGHFFWAAHSSALSSIDPVFGLRFYTVSVYL